MIPDTQTIPLLFSLSLRPSLCCECSPSLPSNALPSPCHRPLHTALFHPSSLVMRGGSSKHLLLSSAAASMFPCRFVHLHTVLHLISKNPPPPVPLNLSLPRKSCGFRAVAPVKTSRTEDGSVITARLELLKTKLESEGIYYGSCEPGQHSCLLCPKCRGGQKKERSLSVFLREDGELATWSCFRGGCGWRGHIQASTEDRGHTSTIERIEAEEYIAVGGRFMPLGSSLKGSSTTMDRLADLKSKLEKEGIHFQSITPGEYLRMFCPKCGGGQEKLRSFSLFVREDLELAMWQCIRDHCRWRGHVQTSRAGNRTNGVADQSVKVNGYRLNMKKTFKLEVSKETNGNASVVNQTMKAKRYKELTDEGLRLEPLCEKLISYFSERKISIETLQRNGVMQRRCRGEIVIAFPYIRDGMTVSCKYRSIRKKFWQEKDTERIYYGVDDIKLANDIIIVEGEIDKLSIEEAGYRNCISVPNGAPRKISRNEDTKQQYMYNCEGYFQHVSRFILATDADPPGQTLAAELAKCFGIDRCWRIKWPKKNEAEVYKDANEVLVCLGPDALKDLVENAEPWLPICT